MWHLHTQQHNYSLPMINNEIVLEKKNKKTTWLCFTVSGPSNYDDKVHTEGRCLSPFPVFSSQHSLFYP